MASQIMTQYFHSIGSDYLKEILQPLILELNESSLLYEVNIYIFLSNTILD